MRTFTLVSENGEILTNGFLPKPVTDCLGENDEYQFDHKEYLISIEKENVSISRLGKSTPMHDCSEDRLNRSMEMKVSAQSRARGQSNLRKRREQLLQPENGINLNESESFITPLSTSLSSNLSSVPRFSYKHPVTVTRIESNKSRDNLENEELITPRSAELTKNDDLLNLLTPRCSDTSICRDDVSSLLNLLKTPANQRSFHSSLQAHQPTHIHHEKSQPNPSSDALPSFSSLNLQKPANILSPSASTSASTSSFSSTITTTTTTPARVNSLHSLLLPSHKALMTNDISYYQQIFSSSPYQSISCYQQFQYTAIHSLIRLLLFTRMKA